jgi:hypothetical protein
MALPVEEMVRVAQHMLERVRLGHPVHAPLAGDLACHVLALIEELERARASPPRPRTIVHSPGGRWDLFEADRDAARFVAVERAGGSAVEAWNVGQWTWHRDAGARHE